MPEAIIEPDLPIIDPHHHLWDRRPVMHLLPRPEHPFDHISHRKGHYLLDHLLGDTASGHNILATVFLECRSMYRSDGPAEMRCLGETEFVNGVAAMAASGLYGRTLACAGIVSTAELLLGADVGRVLDEHMRIAGPRFKGIRRSTSFDTDPGVLGPLNRNSPGVMMEPKFREGFAELGKRGLSFDAWLLEPQLPEVIDLARAFPETRIVLDHVGTPLGIASYGGKRHERFGTWRDNIRELARCENVYVKLGGLAMPFCNFPSMLSPERASSEQLAEEWGPYVEVCIEAFGVQRAMFESNFPVDEVSCDYATLWNALKLIARSASPEEKHELFFGSANRFYRLGLSA